MDPREGAPAGIRSSTPYLRELEGLRGLAILIVVLFHSDCVARFPSQETVGTWPFPLLAIVRAGYTGVTLFFVLSAFLLSLPMLKAGDVRGASALTFYRRRALRILPLYWSVVIVGSFLAASTPYDLLRALPFLVFAQGVWMIPQIRPFTDVLWSLATEVQFYLLLPLLPHFLGSPARRRLGMLFLLCFAAVYVALLWGAFNPLLGLNVWVMGPSIVGRGPVFLLGILAAWLYVRFGERLRAWRPLALTGDVALVACVFGLGFLLQPVVSAGYLVGEYPRWVAWHIVEGALWTAIVLLVLIAPLRLRALVVNRLMARLGLLSYSIYLLHWPMLLGSGALMRSALAPPPGWNLVTGAWMLATLVVVVGVATVTYRVIERPFLVRKARIGEEIEPSGALAPPRQLATAPSPGHAGS